MSIKLNTSTVQRLIVTKHWLQNTEYNAALKPNTKAKFLYNYSIKINNQSLIKYVILQRVLKRR